MIEERSIRLLETLEKRVAALVECVQRERAARHGLEQRLAELEAAASAAAATDDVGARLVGRSADAAGAADAASGDATSPDKSGSYNTTADPDVGARLVGRSADAAGDADATADPDATSPMCRTTDKSGSYNAAAAAVAHTDTTADPDATSPDKSGSYNAAAAAVAHTDTTADPDVGARLVGRSAAAAGAPSPQALLAEWYRRYPAAFFKGHTRPLKVGIHETLIALEPWPEKLVRRALACYVNLPRYLKAVRQGAERIGLDGQPAGRVDAAAAEHAGKKLERLKAEGRGKGRAAPVQPRRAEGRDKPGRGKAAGKSAAGKGPAGKGPAGKGPAGKGPAGEGAAGQAPAAAKASPGPESGQPARSAPATLEEKLAALVAKHRQG